MRMSVFLNQGTGVNNPFKDIALSNIQIRHKMSLKLCGEWEGWALVNRFNQTSGVTAVTPTGRP